MEVRIRLQKAGQSATGKTNYRIVAISRPQARQARHLEILGSYDPMRKPAALSINREQLNRWIKKGAQMSDTVKSLVKSQMKG